MSERTSAVARRCEKRTEVSRGHSSSANQERRFKAMLREIFRRGRGRNLRRVIAELNEATVGWVNYFRLAQVKGVFEDLDQWIRRKLRCILWRQWKKPRTRARKLMSFGLAQDRAYISAYNGRGTWWNAGASHMNARVTARWLYKQGLVSLLYTHQRFADSIRTAVCRTACTVV